MSKQKKNKRASKPKIEVHDLEPDKDPKGGDTAPATTTAATGSKLIQASHDMKKGIIANFRV